LAAENGTQGVTRGRVFLVHAIIAVLVGGAAFAIITDKERWPFSPYPMYSYIDKKRSVMRLELVGLAENGAETPLVIMKQLPPWDDARLMKSLRTMLKTKNAALRVKDALKDLLARYETLRRRGEHSGVPLRGLRLYRLTWKEIGPGSFNDSGADKREWVAEYP
jgi:hypothetical protein